MVAWLCVALLPVSGPPVFLLPLTSNFPRGHKMYMASTGGVIASDMDSYSVNFNLIIMPLFQLFYIHSFFPTFITFT